MRFRKDIETDLKNATTPEAQLRLTNELLLDIRSLLMASPFTDLNVQAQPQVVETKEVRERDPNDVHMMELPLSSRTKKIMKDAKIKYLSDLEKWTAESLLRMRNFGDIGLAELRTIVAQYGITIQEY